MVWGKESQNVGTCPHTLDIAHDVNHVQHTHLRLVCDEREPTFTRCAPSGGP